MCSTNYNFARDEEGEREGARGLRLVHVGIEVVGSDGNTQDVEEEEEGKDQSTAKLAAQPT